MMTGLPPKPPAAPTSTTPPEVGTWRGRVRRNLEQIAQRRAARGFAQVITAPAVAPLAAAAVLVVFAAVAIGALLGALIATSRDAR